MNNKLDIIIGSVIMFFAVSFMGVFNYSLMNVLSTKLYLMIGFGHSISDLYIKNTVKQYNSLFSIIIDIFSAVLGWPIDLVYSIVNAFTPEIKNDSN